MSNYSKYRNKSGIYKLTCNINGKVYVGKSVDIYRRLRVHKSCKPGYKNGYFQRAIIKYGWENFTLEILEILEDFDKKMDNVLLLERESYYIELFNSTDIDKGYNLCKFSTDRTGIPLSDETKEKIRQSHIGKIISEESKEKMSKAKIGTTHSQATKEKIGKAHSGKVLSEEHIQKMKLRTHSDETKEKMRKPKSEEHKQKMRLRTHSEETKEKIRQSRLNNILKLNQQI